MRIPNHIGVIPDGNRRYAVSKGLSKDKGYNLGIASWERCRGHCVGKSHRVSMPSLLSCISTCAPT